MRVQSFDSRKSFLIPDIKTIFAYCDKLFLLKIALDFEDT